LASRVFVSVRVDAIPERSKGTWYKAATEDVFYDECFKLRGKDHSFMPIAVRVVSQAGLNAWVAKANSRRPKRLHRREPQRLASRRNDDSPAFAFAGGDEGTERIREG
jgi:heme/copper-type cytochrome/quinol oxidase subunit 2